MTHVLFTEEEMEWLDKKKFNWTIKKGCPKKIEHSLKKKLKVLKERR